jgi:hypothetical protein
LEVRGQIGDNKPFHQWKKWVARKDSIQPGGNIIVKSQFVTFQEMIN